MIGHCKEVTLTKQGVEMKEDQKVKKTVRIISFFFFFPVDVMDEPCPEFGSIVVLSEHLRFQSLTSRCYAVNCLVCEAFWTEKKGSCDWSNERHLKSPSHHFSLASIIAGRTRYIGRKREKN